MTNEEIRNDISVGRCETYGQLRESGMYRSNCEFPVYADST